MKPITFILSSIVAAAIIMVGCSMSSGVSISDGNLKDATVKKSVKIGNFNKISARNGIRVVYTQGKSTGVANIATTPSAEKYLKVSVSNGELTVRYEGKGNINIKGPSIISVSSPDLQEVDLSSAARLNVKGNLNLSNKLEIDMSSASKASFNEITAKEIEIDLSSSASVNIGKANVNNLNIDMSSASKVEIDKAIAKNLDVETSSASKAIFNYFNGTGIQAEASSASTISIAGITASKIYGEASSGAKVVLKGQCEYLNRDASSGGKVDISGLNVPNLPKKSSKKHAPVREP